MQVSACAQGGKDVGRFHNMVLFRFCIYKDTILRYSVNILIKKLSYIDNFRVTWGVGRVVVLELLVARLVALPQSGQPAIEATPRDFRVCRAAAAALKDRGRLKGCPQGGSYHGGIDNREGAN
jgi:hypothetical protein